MIQIEKLTTGYSRDKPLLKDYSFKFKDNRIYGILGESGCGKTTLLKTLAGLIYPLSGEIFIDGEILTKASKNNVYMMHQNYTCFNWLTCLDNVLIIEKVKRNKITKDVKDRALYMLERVGLKNEAGKYPTQLSGGMKQRLALARILYAEPQILLMDEPLSALDETTRKSMQDLIMEMQKKTKSTIILVTHSESEAKRMCHEIIKM